MATLRHLRCLHEWEVPADLAARVENDVNGGVAPVSPPITCPGCKVPSRYSEFEIVRTDA